jgi:hypothetical protein
MLRFDGKAGRMTVRPFLSRAEWHFRRAGDGRGFFLLCRRLRFWDEPTFERPYLKDIKKETRHVCPHQ